MSGLELLVNVIFVLGSVKQCDACFRISKNYRWGACKTRIMLFYLLILLLILKQISCSFINSKTDITSDFFTGAPLCMKQAPSRMRSPK